MAQTSIGFNGTVSEIQWTTLAPLLGNGDCVAASGHLAASQVSGFRRVLIESGIAQARGVATTLSAAESPAADMPAPTAGQFHLVVLRRVWATKATSILTIPHSTTTEASPTVPPTTFPAAMLASPGVEYDQPLYWAWVNVSTTNVKLFDLRRVPNSLRLADAERGTRTVSSDDERNKAFPNPVQGDRVYRFDKGYLEAYFSTFNSTSNPGGRASAGWGETGADTGWITATLGATWASVAGETVQYRRKDGAVWWRGRAQSSGTVADILNVPSGFRIDGGINNIFTADAGNAVRMNLTDTGILRILGTISSGNLISMSHLTYLALY